VPRQVLTPDDRRNIARWAAEGLSDREMSIKLDRKVTPTGVHAYRKRAGIAPGWVKPPNALQRGEHGTDLAWTQGCDCPECRAAHTARQKATMERLAERTAGGARQRDPWEPWEDELLLAPRENGQTVDLAVYLGRSYSAITQRLQRLRRVAAATNDQARGTLF
jgi:hypothetical protein